jgi:hypothetical protein
MNVGTAVILLRFVLGADVAQGLRTGTVKSLELVLSENSNCEGTGCGVMPMTGAVSVHVLRNDWVEGATAAYAGADMCRRTIGDPGRGWGAADAAASAATFISRGVDYSNAVGEAPIAPTTTMLAVTLSPSDVAAAWATFGDGTTTISFFVDEYQTGRFVAASSESALRPHPVLKAEICP